MTQKMNKFNSLKKTTKVDFATYLGVIVVFIITTILQNNVSHIPERHLFHVLPSEASEHGSITSVFGL